jgi:uncharacterized membrane protein
MRASVLSVLIAVAFGAAACSEGTTEQAPAPADAPPAAVLGGVDLNQPLRALGTEPFWGLDVSSEGLSWTGVDETPLTAPNPGPGLAGTTANWRTRTADGQTLVLTLIATECSDGMSDRVYPLTAKVELGEREMIGCAASQAFLATAPAP